MNIAGMHLTDFHKKKLIKDAKYEQKQRQKAIESLSIEEHKIVRSIVAQFYCTTALQLELIDELNAISNIAMKYPFIQDFMRGMEMLNTDLYKIAVKSEKDDLNRQEIEKMMGNIIGKMPTLNLKQLELLEEFINNLKHKK
nr:MAG TPA: hypothetical protein [Caudoviricetes sp.]